MSCDSSKIGYGTYTSSYGGMEGWVSSTAKYVDAGNSLEYLLYKNLEQKINGGTDVYYSSITSNLNSDTQQYKNKDVFNNQKTVNILKSINSTDFAQPNFVFNTNPDRDDFKSSLTIPYINHDNKWYWVLFLIHTNEDDTSTGNGLTVMWSTSEQNPVGKDFRLVEGQTRFCNKLSNLDVIDFNYYPGQWCCTNNQGGNTNNTCVTDSGPSTNVTILDYCCIFACASDGSKYVQVPMQTTNKDNLGLQIVKRNNVGIHHPNSEGNKGCNHDCHTKSSNNMALAIGLTLGLGLPFLLVISYLIYKRYKK